MTGLADVFEFPVEGDTMNTMAPVTLSVTPATLPALTLCFFLQPLYRLPQTTFSLLSRTNQFKMVLLEMGSGPDLLRLGLFRQTDSGWLEVRTRLH